MADALVALLQAVPGLAQLAQSLASTTDTAKRNAQLIEFQQALIGLNSLVASVQQQNATLRREKDDAEAELKRMKNWGAQKERYQLVSPWPGAFVWALKKAGSDGQPPHYLCPTCFQNEKPSVMQGRSGGYHKVDGYYLSVFLCHACKTEASTGYRGGAVAPQYAEDIQPAS